MSRCILVRSTIVSTLCAVSQHRCIHTSLVSVYVGIMIVDNRSTAAREVVYARIGAIDDSCVIEYASVYYSEFRSATWSL